MYLEMFCRLINFSKSYTNITLLHIKFQYVDIIIYIIMCLIYVENFYFLLKDLKNLIFILFQPCNLLLCSCQYKTIICKNLQFKYL